MWGEPSSPADAAVGKGLMTLGVALGIPAFLHLALFDLTGPRHNGRRGNADGAGDCLNGIAGRSARHLRPGSDATHRQRQMRTFPTICHGSSWTPS